MEAGKSLYEVLGVEKHSTKTEIKRAYHVLALKMHPDKNPGDQEANDKFQSLQKVYTILSDDDKRKLYDETGRSDDDSLSAADMSELHKYYSVVRVTPEDIDAFARTYRGSQEEVADVVAAYTRFSGNMKMLFSHVMLSDPELDSHRFMDIIDKAIAAGDAKQSKSYSAWAKRTSAKPRPADPLKNRVGSSASEGGLPQALMVASKARRAANDALVAELENKYTSTAKHYDEPSEEMFAAAQARVLARQAAASGGSHQPGRAGAKRQHSKAEADSDETAGTSSSGDSSEEDEDTKVKPQRRKRAGRAAKATEAADDSKENVGQKKAGAGTKGKLAGGGPSGIGGRKKRAA